VKGALGLGVSLGNSVDKFVVLIHQFCTQRRNVMPYAWEKIFASRRWNDVHAEMIYPNDMQRCGVTQETVRRNQERNLGRGV